MGHTHTRSTAGVVAIGAVYAILLQSSSHYKIATTTTKDKNRRIFITGNVL